MTPTRNRQGRRGQTRRAPAHKQPMPLWKEILLHILAIAIALVLFALPHHVIGHEKKGLGVQSVRGGSSAQTAETAADTQTADASVQAAADQTADAQAEQIETAQDTGSADAASSDTAAADTASTDTAAAQTESAVGDFSAKWADKFITGEPQRTDNSYVSENVNVTIEEHDYDNVVFYIADIYVRDITCLRREFAEDKFGKSLSEGIDSVSSRVNSIVTINGDYYGMRDGGVVEANGTLYQNDTIYNDICVLYWDGTMECFHKDEFDCDAAIAKGAYQIWNFGPALLDANGEALSEFPSRYDDVKKHNPRAAIGYYEPGHYCFIAVDGRSSTSDGLSLANMSLLAKTLGLKMAYNLDGGKTAWMYYNGATVNNPSSGGRECSDYICIEDVVR